MKQILTLFLLFCMALGGAQVRLTQKQYDNLPDKQKRLYDMVLAHDNAKETRVLNYLATHPNERRSNEDANGNVLVMTDVIGETPIFTTLDNLDASRATGTTALQIGGSLGLNLDGTDMMVGVWDGGPIQTTHTEFLDQSGTISRVTNLEGLNTDGTGTIDNHGTHVSGTIAARGVNPAAKGMATNVNIRTYNFLNDTPEMVSALASTENPLILSNHSYGVPVSGAIPNWFMGSYRDDARIIDNIALDNPEYLIVMSAGNSGTTSYTGGLIPGFDKLTGDKVAKNNLVVANASAQINPFSNELDSFSINPGSSQGPTDDLRVKPDITGIGTNLISPISGDGYASFTGTSMSAPNVTGSVVLLQQLYNQTYGSFMSSAMVKALVCHTAVDDIAVAGPDPVYGWGLLNAKEAAEVILDSDVSQATLQELTLNDGGTYTTTFQVDAGEKLSATICWTDVAGTSVGDGDLNNQTPRLVNDLDIRLEKDGEVFFPWKLEFTSGLETTKGDNSRDNVERIDIENPAAGTYTLTVSHKGTLASTNPPFGTREQNFSLVMTGNNFSLGLDDNLKEDGIGIFPNPSNGVFTLSFDLNSPEDVDLNIFDLRGRKVFSDSYTNGLSRFNQSIDLSGMDKGVYLVKINQGENTVTKRIMLK